MPYNTRRKSLSLSELGITLPKRSRALSQSTSPNKTIVEGDEQPPVKKSKRSHPSISPPPSSTSHKSPSRPSVQTLRFKEEKSRPSAQLSPPPSPVLEGSSHRVDVEGINDDIVVATIRQLEQTGNRPHLVKELAAILSTSLDSAEKSTNPTALISSRLTAYINRSWPAISPCPLAKDLTNAHPRRLYFYLTTLPRQPLPENINTFASKPHRVISPSLSSNNSNKSDSDDDEDEAYHLRARQAPSPSPEVDLSSPDLYPDENPPTQGAPFSASNSVPRDRSSSATDTGSLLPNGGIRRGGSPQLENEERDFKLVATAVHEEAMKRRRSSEETEQQQKKKQQEEEEKKARLGKKSATSSLSSSAQSSVHASPARGSGSEEQKEQEKARSASPHGGEVEMADPVEQSSDIAIKTEHHSNEADSVFQHTHGEDDAAAATALFGGQEDGLNRHVSFFDEQERSVSGGLQFASSPLIMPRDRAGDASTTTEIKLEEGRDADIGGSVSASLNAAGEQEGEGESASLRIDTRNGYQAGEDATMGGSGDDSSTANQSNTTGSLETKNDRALKQKKETISQLREGGAGMEVDAQADLDLDVDDWAKSLQSPETVDVEELEDLFDAY